MFCFMTTLNRTTVVSTKSFISRPMMTLTGLGIGPGQSSGLAARSWPSMHPSH